jgi:hypothetical protein
MPKLQFTPEMLENFKQDMKTQKKPDKAQERYEAVSDNEDWVDPDYDHGHGEDFDQMVQEELAKRQGKGVNKNG